MRAEFEKSADGTYKIVIPTVSDNNSAKVRYLRWRSRTFRVPSCHSTLAVSRLNGSMEIVPADVLGISLFWTVFVAIGLCGFGGGATGFCATLACLRNTSQRNARNGEKEESNISYRRGRNCWLCRRIVSSLPSTLCGTLGAIPDQASIRRIDVSHFGNVALLMKLLATTFAVQKSISGFFATLSTKKLN